MKIELFGSTDVGQVRDHNEDDFVLCRDLATQDWSFKRDEQFEIGDLGLILFVADGMGGTNAGEVASATAVESVKELFHNVTALPGSGSDKDILNFLKQAIVKAHDKIVYKAIENPTFAGMGTTAVLAWVFKDAVYVAWSGDSRMYVYRDDVDLYPATDDHAMVWDLVLNGQLTAEEARTHEASNIITQSLGDESRAPKPDAKKYDICKGDRIMLCSDGLNGMLSDNMMYGILSARLSTAETCRELIAAANQAGGTDNITVQLLDVLDGNKAPAAVKTPKTGEVKTRAGAGSNANAGRVNPSVTSNGGGNTKIIAGVVAVLVVLALLAYFFVLKPSGTTGDDDTTDSTNTIVDSTLIPPIDNPEPDEQEPEGTNSSPSSDNSTTAPVNNAVTPTPPAGNNTTVAATPPPAANTPVVTQPPVSNTPPTNVLTPVTPGGSKPTIPVEKPDSISQQVRDSIFNSRTP